MKIIFHERYLENYASDPAAETGRLEPTLERMRLDSFYEFVKPKPAKKEDIFRAHSEDHYSYMKRRKLLFEVAMLGAGGAIETAEYSYENKCSAFGLIRPPGHHASADSVWGFCFFNNMAISLLKLFNEGKINSAFVLDFDLHVGDGNINILEGRDDLRVDIMNPSGYDEKEYLDSVKDRIDSLENYDIIAVSAGFDQGLEDWGDLLGPLAYKKIGMWLKEKSEQICHGRRFAILEGGYNFNQVAIHCDAFCKGFGSELL